MVLVLVSSLAKMFSSWPFGGCWPICTLDCVCPNWIPQSPEQKTTLVTSQFWGFFCFVFLRVSEREIQAEQPLVLSCEFLEFAWRQLKPGEPGVTRNPVGLYGSLWPQPLLAASAFPPHPVLEAAGRAIQIIPSLIHCLISTKTNRCIHSASAAETDLSSNPSGASQYNATMIMS